MTTMMTVHAAPAEGARSISQKSLGQTDVLPRDGSRCRRRRSHRHPVRFEESGRTRRVVRVAVPRVTNAYP
jgi:uncharacterized protein (DUF2384 family)